MVIIDKLITKNTIFVPIFSQNVPVLLYFDKNEIPFTVKKQYADYVEIEIDTTDFKAGEYIIKLLDNKNGEVAKTLAYVIRKK